MKYPKLYEELIVLKYYLLLTSLVFVTPIFSMNKQKLREEIENQKHVITQQNFDTFINKLKNQDATIYFAEALKPKLQQFVGQELSVNEWNEKVLSAYNQILQRLDSATQITIKINNIQTKVILASIWAIPSH